MVSLQRGSKTGPGRRRKLSLAPNYLIDLITIKKQSRYSLRSNESIFLELPGIKSHPTLGDCTFQSRGRGRTPIHYLYGYVPPNGVVILKLLI